MPGPVLRSHSHSFDEPHDHCLRSARLGDRINPTECSTSPKLANTVVIGGDVSGRFGGTEP